MGLLNRRTYPLAMGMTALVLAAAVGAADAVRGAHTRDRAPRAGAEAVAGLPRVVGLPAARGPAASSGGFRRRVPFYERVPVLLVPGWRDDAADLAPLRRRFLDAGWDSARVEAVGFDDPVGSNRAHAREVARAVLRLQERTGAPRVDVVAHSMGGLAVRYYLWNGGAETVRRAVFLATPHRGTLTAYMAWGDGGREMEPGSPFLVFLTRSRPVPEGVAALTVRTPLDLHITPDESAILPGVPDVEVCCPTHEGLLDDDETFRAVERFLRG